MNDQPFPGAPPDPGPGGEPWVFACRSEDLLDGATGARVDLPSTGQERPEPAFVIRHDGTAHAYMNRCAHVSVELDWLEGQFFDEDARFIVCTTHGAMYEPESGRCVGGPCAGRGLERLACLEVEGRVWVSRL